MKIKKIELILVNMVLLCLLSACGVTIERDYSSKEEQQDLNEEDDSSNDTKKISEWKISLPSELWRSEYLMGMESWNLYKDNCYYNNESTISIFFNNMNAEESMLGSKEMTKSLGNVSLKDIDYEINGVNCPAYENYFSEEGVTFVKVFYPLSSNSSLQIKVFVKKENIQGIDPYSDEVKQIIQSLVDENGLLSESLSGDVELEKIDINADDLLFEGELYKEGNYSVIIPKGWKLFSSKYNSKYVIKDGTSIDDYESKPYILIQHNDKDAYESMIEDKKYYDNDNVEELNVTVCGLNCYAIKYKQEMASKPVYWEYVVIYMPISKTENISFRIITDSSEFECVGVLDDDVRQIIASVKKHFE